MIGAVDLPIRDIVFDLGGVLVDWDPRYLFNTHFNAAPSQIETFLSSVCTPEWHAELDGGRSFGEATAALIAKYPDHAEWIEAYDRHWDKMFAGSIDETVEVLTELKQHGPRVHALSNYPTEKLAFLYATYPFMRIFDTVIVSGLVGLTKPDPGIYSYTLERIGAPTCVFVDDRPENVAAARACGMSAIHFDGSECFDALRKAVRAGSGR